MEKQSGMYPDFSVSMCVYGGDDPAYFKTAVDSVLEQTVKPSEIVLVVDGPVPDALEEVLSAYAQNAVFQILRLPENQGHGNARRIGLENCRYELVALMDADDISPPDRFEKELAIFQADPAVSVVGGNLAEFFDTPENIVSYRNVPQTDAEIRKYLRKRCPMNQPTVMFRKKDVQEVGGYIDWYCDEDYYLWLRLFLAGKRFYNIQESLVYFRLDPNVYKRRGGLKYFKSEAKLQKYMLQNKVIGFGTYTVNVAKRLIVQVLLPNRLRGFVFQKFARK